MSNKTIIKKLLRENLDTNCPFNLLETLVAEDYPTSFDFEHFGQLPSFRKRIEYCEEHLSRISSGSSRIVYKIDETKVLKLAKNKKGLGQNEVEIQWGRDDYFGSILARTHHYDNDDLWVEMELAKKVRKADFIRHAGCDIDDMFKYMDNFINRNNRKQVNYGLRKSMEDEMDNNEFVASILDFAMNTKAMHGDLCKLNSYGLVQRDGEEIMVLIDFGFSTDVYETYYS